MIGGWGGDTFQFSFSTENSDYDTITDFQHGIDRIDVSQVDARPDLVGDQTFTFDSTPDGFWEEWSDGLDGSGGGLITSDPGPVIDGEAGEIEYRHDGGYTYVYLSYADGMNDVSIRLHGTIDLTASDFLL
jgi:hypothetical protein